MTYPQYDRLWDRHTKMQDGCDLIRHSVCDKLMPCANTVEAKILSMGITRTQGRVRRVWARLVR